MDSFSWTSFESATTASDISTRRAPTDSKPSMMRPRAFGSRRPLQFPLPCELNSTEDSKVFTKNVTYEEECAQNVVAFLLKECIDDDDVPTEGFEFVECDSEEEDTIDEVHEQEFPVEYCQDMEDEDEVRSLAVDDEDPETEALDFANLAFTFAGKVIGQGMDKDLEDMEEEHEESFAEASSSTQVALASRPPTTWNLSPSVGTWMLPRSFEEPEVSIVALPSMVVSEERQWNFSPSVGTWMLPRYEVVDEPEKPSETAQVVEEECSWNLQPSVGTWAMPLPARCFITPTAMRAPLSVLVNLSEPSITLDELASPASPKASSRGSRRRIIGGVGPRVQALDEVITSPTPTLRASESKTPTMAGSPAFNLRQRTKDVKQPIVFRLDEDRTDVVRGPKRMSSITAMFESMGSAEVFQLDAHDAPKEDRFVQAQQPFKASKMSPLASAGAKMLRSSSTSAMSLDLGLKELNVSGRMATSSMGSRSSSVGALKSLKGISMSSDKAAMLPKLLKVPPSANDWTVDATFAHPLAASRAWNKSLPSF